MHCCCFQTIPSTLVLAYYLNLVVDECRVVTTLGHVAVNGLGAKPLWQLFYTSKWGVVRFHCYDLQMGQRGSGEGTCTVVHLRISFGVLNYIDYYSIAFFTLSWTYHSALVFQAYLQSSKMVWSSKNYVSCWVPYSVANGRVYDLVDAVAPRQKKDARGVLVVDKRYASRAFI